MDMGNLATELFNNLFWVVGAWGLYYAYGLYKTRLTNGSSLLTQGITCLLLSIVLLRFYWAMALKFAPEGEVYHPFFVEYNWAITAPTAVVFAIGVYYFVDSIDRMKTKDKIINFAACMVIAALLAAI